MVDTFDYEAKSTIQGRGEISSHQRDLAGMRLARALAQLPPGPGRLLLLGCGAGRHLRALHRERPDLRLHGSDLSLTAVSEARRYPDETAYTVADALALPYADQSFDMILLFDLLEHVPSVEQALDEIARTLKPGGLLHAFVPCEAQPGTLFALLRNNRPVPIHRWKRDHVGHIQQLTVDQVERLCRERRLAPIHRSFSFHPFGQVHDMLDYWARETNLRETRPLVRRLVGLATRVAMIVTWRAAYGEAQLFHWCPYATGLHLTALRQSVVKDG